MNHSDILTALTALDVDDVDNVVTGMALDRALIGDASDPLADPLWRSFYPGSYDDLDDGSFDWERFLWGSTLQSDPGSSMIIAKALFYLSAHVFNVDAISFVLDLFGIPATVSERSTFFRAGISAAGDPVCPYQDAFVIDISGNPVPALVQTIFSRMKPAHVVINYPT
jgi:hypothetical protein